MLYIVEGMIDNLTNLVLVIMKIVISLLGLYSAYMIIASFPKPAGLFLVLLIFFVAWLVPDDPKPIRAIPVVRIHPDKAIPDKTITTEGHYQEG